MCSRGQGHPRPRSSQMPALERDPTDAKRRGGPPGLGGLSPAARASAPPDLGTALATHAQAPLLPCLICVLSFSAVPVERLHGRPVPKDTRAAPQSVRESSAGGVGAVVAGAKQAVTQICNASHADMRECSSAQGIKCGQRGVKSGWVVLHYGRTCRQARGQCRRHSMGMQRGRHEEHEGPKLRQFSVSTCGGDGGV